MPYTQFACVGTGISAIGLGATLQRWYGITDIQFFERHADLGGTWYINKYSGCACDVPSALYSLSYEQNPEWSRVLPTTDEIENYTRKVASKYHLLEKMRFSVDIESCIWQVETSRWRLHVRDIKTGNSFIHECQVLFSAAGQLVHPRELDVQGQNTFKGPIFHSARWRSDVDLTGKDVVIFGNGCTAAQIVPAIVGKTKSLTQVIRSKHWIFPPIDFEYRGWMRWMFKYIPLTLWLHRLHIFLLAESDFRLFPMTRAAARLRETRRAKVESYMRNTAPEKYHDLLIPDFDIGCKRRIFDCGYLNSLQFENLTLTMDTVREIVPEGIRTDKEVIKADVIVMANGFRTNEFIDPMKVTGRGGETLTKHWAKFGGPEAYNCSAVSGFPNFFMILGPNAATGHTSAIMASENTANYAMRILKPVVKGYADSVEVKEDAEKQYVYKLQDDLKNTVWSSGCNSWYVKKSVEKGKQWNAMSYPYSQAHFWYRSLFPRWKDWSVKVGLQRAA
ncbi:FAD/NAD(P)-binding domain-containing protein [Zopfia rhizophila CBS 207.26]|uniref:FAD/NAD(P)-binding domain-containing protein n=1 Tax=Zopfia rhizophila CBS 207.26 TaxID=1314779 RepID=A0A6A6DVD3_9PEZI|nr:FAD/NAD(P)-binding domain-containing protein [Zopfia rhizophila CBS 207.26]